MSNENEKPTLFKSGMDFLYPNTVNGPSVYGMLEGAWTVIALIQGIRNKVWESDVNTVNPIIGVWAKMQLIERVPDSDDVRLTVGGKSVVASAGLLEYEFSMMNQQLDADFVTDPAKYEALRTALGDYMSHYIPEVYDWVANAIPEDQPKTRVLDYCGGAGVILVNTLERRPLCSGVLFDKAPALDVERYPPEMQNRMCVLEGDALGDHPLFEAEDEMFDVVIVSEILHCKGPEGRAALLKRAYDKLKMGGSLMIIEQIPNLRLDWRMFDMTEAGQCISIEQAAYEVQIHPVQIADTIQAISHWGMRCIKVEAQQENENDTTK